MKSTVLSIIIAIAFIGGAFWLTRQSSTLVPEIIDGSNVTIVDGKQIIEIKAKGGFEPRRSIAKAGMPTLLRFDTSGTFDCSSSVRIPSMGIEKLLPQSGTTDIDIGSLNVETLQGTCGMGMYPFEVEFRM